MVLTLSFLGGCTGSSKPELSSSQILEKYVAFKADVEEEAQRINSESLAVQAFKDKKALDLSANPYFTQNFYYDIHGNNISGNEETLRGTVAYQRLMGHLQYFSTLGLEGDTPVLSVISKLIDNSSEDSFIGIDRLICPVERFSSALDLNSSSRVLLIDSGKTVVDLTNNFGYPVEDLGENLQEIIKMTSTLEETKGVIILEGPDLAGTYSYQTGDGVCVLMEK